MVGLFVPEAIRLTGSRDDTPLPELVAACAALLGSTGVVVLKGGHSDDPHRAARA